MGGWWKPEEPPVTPSKAWKDGEEMRGKGTQGVSWQSSQAVACGAVEKKHLEGLERWTSRQNAESATWLFLVAYYKIGEARKIF